MLFDGMLSGSGQNAGAAGDPEVSPRVPQKPEKQRGRTGDYQTIVDDIFSISRGWLELD